MQSDADQPRILNKKRMKVIQRIKNYIDERHARLMKELHELGITFNQSKTMKEKEEKAQGVETINFGSEESVNAEVEQLRKELEQAKQYKDWWLLGAKKADELHDEIRDLRAKLDKVAAVAGLYLDSKVWNK